MSFILSIDKAAKSAGYSLRQFRRLYNERDGGKVTVIGGKAFVLTKDLEKWKEKRNGSLV